MRAACKQGIGEAWDATMEHDRQEEEEMMYLRQRAQLWPQPP